MYATGEKLKNINFPGMDKISNEFIRCTCDSVISVFVMYFNIWIQDRSCIQAMD